MKDPQWLDANQQHLVGEIARIKALLAGGATPAVEPRSEARASEEISARDSALSRLQRAFGLTDFERDVLLLCAACALDASVPALLAQLSGAGGPAVPTFGLALAHLPGGHWSALTPAAPLRHWSLIGLAPADHITAAPLRIDERVLHHLAGVDYLDERLAGRIQAPAVRPPTPEDVALAGRLLAERPAGQSLAVQLTGAEPASQAGVAVALGRAVDAPVYELQAEDIPTTPADRAALARLWDREAALTGALLFIPAVAEHTSAARALVDLLQGPVILAAREPIDTSRFLSVVDVTPPKWRDTGPARRGATRDDPTRTPAPGVLSDLSQHIDPLATWDDLVLPAAQTALLHQVAGQVRRAEQVYMQWGFAGKSHRGLGISALFSGPSGTGKTMAAEVLANELDRPLYRIDLSAVVSKYIGETEKNLRRLFDGAEETGALLFFDEADALFGKRSEVKDSHDRYANIEVSYLLQRMEAYTGLAILATNMRSALDPAFVRRLRFIVDFPFPDAAGRAEIWSKVFPAGTPCDGIDVIRLGRMAVAGGNIRNIAVNAAFLAADAAAPVGMPHLLQAARAEYAKLERPQGEIDLVTRS